MFLDDTDPFALPPEQKCRFLCGQHEALLEHHYQHCPEYARFVDDWRLHCNGALQGIEDYPFVPVTAFKQFDLRSTSGDGTVVKSSTTTSDLSSKIFVDKATRKRQSLSANKILGDFVGQQRRPYLVFDVEKTVRGTESVSARGAAIMSLAHLASEFFFVMRDDAGQLRLDEHAFRSALDAIGDKPFLAYGFTYILYQAHQELAERKLVLQAAHPDSWFLHSGGWKKLTNIAVDKPAFDLAVSEPWQLPASSVIDFYGTVEQIGVPYPDCPAGFKHVPYWAEIVIRAADSLEPAPVNETGLIQLVNCLPLSAPNQNVLTEDLGRVVLEDGCECGRRGRAFEFKGRAPRSENRGCSDVARY